MTDFEPFLNSRLQKKKDDNSLRFLRPQVNAVDFSSNDYLGFARSKELSRLIQEKVTNLNHRNGATGSRLLSGNDEYTEEVERKLASYFHSKACLIFNSGYTANLAILSSLPQRGDTLLYDELVHASIKDGARLSLASRISFKHNDINDLEKKLQSANGNAFVVIESVYSMDGDSPNLEAMVSVAEKYNASIIVDEAHSTGIFGAHGSGLVLAEGLSERIPVRIYTFGKAMGIHGACVCGSRALIDYLINFARPFIYTTALPPHSIAAIDCAFDLLKKSEPEITTLHENIQFYLSEKNHSKIKNSAPNHSPIQTILVPGNEHAKRCATFLQNKGLDVRPILSPTVKEGAERLRICIHNYNSKEEITLLVKSLGQLPID